MSLSKFELMLKTDSNYFFDTIEFEQIIQHYLDVGKHTIARKALSLGLQQHPMSITLQLLQVELFMIENKEEEAFDLLEKLQGLNPDNDEIYIQKGTILSQRKQHKKAISEFKKALKCTSDLVDIYALIGMEFLYLEDYKNARINFEKCIELDVEDYSSLYNILYCFESENKGEEAIKFLIYYIDRNPYSEIAWHQLGLQYYRLKNYQKALNAFDYAIAIDESFIGAYLEKAKTLEGLKRYKEAVQNYLITLNLDDPTASTYIRIAECSEELEEMEIAIEYYKKAIHEDPLLERGWLSLTDIYYNKGDYQTALYHINKALQIDDVNPLYWRKFAYINLKLDLLKDAVKAFYTCISLEDDTLEVYIILSDILIFLGEFEEALVVLIKAKNKNRNNAEIEYRLGGLFLVLNQEEYGIKHLKKALTIDFEIHIILKELFPSIINNERVKNTIEKYRINNI